MVTDAVEQGSRFEALYRLHGSRLLRNILLFAGDRDIANDAVAEAFAQAIRRGDAVRDPLPWITRAAFRIAAGALKDRRRTDYPLAEQTYEIPEPALELVAAFAQLSPKQRASVILHFRDGYTLAEVAEIIGSTPSAVGVHLNRARKRLRDLMGDLDA
jgi:RNA polymerase sigma-70 factor (ECF subfamily)